VSKRKAINNKVKNYTVVQANDLIRNKKDFSLWELRIFALLASHVKKDDDDFKTYKFRIKDLLDLFETNSNNLYDEIRKIPERLHSRLIRIPYVDDKGKARTRRYNLVSMSDFPEGNMDDGEYIMLRFDKDLKPLMLKLGEHFTVYKFYNILKLRSPYIFQLYEILKSEEYKGLKEIDLIEFREILQIPSSYKFGNIKQRILEPAKLQLAEHTDITFDYETIKGRGGKILQLHFHIAKNKRIKTPAIEEPILEDVSTSIEEDLYGELYPKVREWVDEKTFKKLIATYPPNQIRDAVNLTLNRLKRGDAIDNIAGHIVSMSKQANLFDAMQDKKEKLVKQKKRVSMRERRKIELESEMKGLYTELQEREEVVIEEIFEQNPGVKEALYKKVVGGKSSLFRKSTKEENFKNPMFIAAFKNAIKKGFPFKFEMLEQEYRPKLKSIKIALQAL